MPNRTNKIEFKIQSSYLRRYKKIEQVKSNNSKAV